MPDNFGLLDALLVAVPLCLAILGFLRGGPAELSSGIGCAIGLAAAWLIASLPSVQVVGPQISLIIAAVGGIAIWRVTRTIFGMVGLDLKTRHWGHHFDSAAGLSLGAGRGVVLVAAGCVFYAAALVPMGLANPSGTVMYPWFLHMASQATNTAIPVAVASISQPSTALSSYAPPPLPDEASQPPITTATTTTAPTATATAAPLLAPPPPAGSHWTPTLRDAGAAAVAAVAVPSIATAARQFAYQPPVPVRQVPPALVETHHNILHPFGGAPVRRAPPVQRHRQN